jgi:hypothetical protein
MKVTGLVLLIARVNPASLMLARASYRRNPPLSASLSVPAADI